MNDDELNALKNEIAILNQNLQFFHFLKSGDFNFLLS